MKFSKSEPDLRRDIPTPFPVGTIEDYTHCRIDRKKHPALRKYNSFIRFGSNKNLAQHIWGQKCLAK